MKQAGILCTWLVLAVAGRSVACDFAPLSGKAGWRKHEAAAANAYAAQKLFGDYEHPKRQILYLGGRNVVLSTWTDGTHSHMSLNGEPLYFPGDQRKAGVAAVRAVRVTDLAPLEVTIYSRMSPRYQDIRRSPEKYMGSVGIKNFREWEAKVGFNALVHVRYTNGSGRDYYFPVTY